MRRLPVLAFAIFLIAAPLLAIITYRDEASVKTEAILLVFLASGILIIAGKYRVIGSGSIDVDRGRNPFLFWLNVGLLVFVVAVCIYIVVFE